MKHCHTAAEMMKMGSFYTYVIIGAVGIVIGVSVIAAVCSFKWYMETKKNPCTCCSFFCCCKKPVKKKNVEGNHPVNVFEQNETGHTWSPVSLPPSREQEELDSSVQMDDSRDPSVCMNFCLSDPVQDCCELFDCDILWRKKSIYTIPIFGRKKQQLQRRPTRPAPPVPKAVVLPQVKNPEPIIFDEEEECEPVPEAPPSPEPVRTIPPKAMYVDPLAFLHKTFAKNNPQLEKEVKDEADGKQEHLYSKFKNMVLSKVKKSASVASVNKLGISIDPNGISNNSSGSNKKLKTGSFASLHNLIEPGLEANYGSKRSLSLASLHMLGTHGENNPVLDPRSRISVLSTVSTATDDIPPCARKDEYIDLEEMSKRIGIKMQAAHALGLNSQSFVGPSSQVSSTPAVAYTPNFMPASAFVNSNIQPPQTVPIIETHLRLDNHDERVHQANYYPPVPASQGRPAVPARTAVGSPIYSVSPSGTLGRPKPVVPPRPPIGEAARAPSSPLPTAAASLPRSPRLIKPSGPPPPPPPPPHHHNQINKSPIESSI